MPRYGVGELGRNGTLFGLLSSLTKTEQVLPDFPCLTWSAWSMGPTSHERPLFVMIYIGITCYVSIINMWPNGENWDT